MTQNEPIIHEEHPLDAQEAGIRQNWLRALDAYHVQFLVLNRQSESDTAAKDPTRVDLSGSLPSNRLFLASTASGTAKYSARREDNLKQLEVKLMVSTKCGDSCQGRWNLASGRNLIPKPGASVSWM